MSLIILSNKEKHVIGKPFTPNIETIGYALAHINRYTGHVGTYSVAQHCVHVAEKLPDHLKLAGLLHDAPEAYIGDVSAPLKRVIADAYKPIEKFYHAVIDEHFGVKTESDVIKEVDLRMLITEAKSFGILTEEFPDYEPYKFEVTPWASEIAYWHFMRMFNELTA